MKWYGNMKIEADTSDVNRELDSSKLGGSALVLPS